MYFILHSSISVMFLTWRGSAGVTLFKISKGSLYQEGVRMSSSCSTTERDMFFQSEVLVCATESGSPRWKTLTEGLQNGFQIMQRILWQLQ